MIKKIPFTLLVVAMAIFSSCNNNKPIEKTSSGYTLGTTYHIKYYAPDDVNYQTQFDSIYQAIVKSMSTYVPSSDISKINNGEDIIVDDMFKDVYKTSKKVWNETDGIFDPTIGIIVNAWGFGPKGEIEDLSDNTIGKLMETVGLEKTKIMDDGTFYKKNPKTQIDFNAIAKGYTLDRVAVFLDSKNVKNYLIEIGGEIVAKGVKQNGKLWKIGIDDPDKHSGESRPLTAVLSITDKAMATSGNYRRYRIDSLTGEKFVHTINTKTGYTSRSNMLSASVIAENCTLADAYATSFMAMGLGKSKEFLNKHSELDAYLIYIDSKGKWQKYITKGFDEKLDK
ncbi:MAG: FAD:protein FMN transferase [Ichthyobacteriaceae bacterium]|nr:FAD:protein FMN transferase [Ichthyobacteriaceae bacterium]